MEKLNKNLLIVIIGVTCFTVFFSFYFGTYFNLESESEQSNDDSEDSKCKLEVINITLIVDFKSKPTKKWENFNLTNSKTSVLDALEKWCDVTIKDYGWGIFVTAIDGESGSWIYYVNEILPGCGAAVYCLSDLDEIKWEQL